MNATINQLPAQSVWFGVGLLAAGTLLLALTWVQERARRTPPTDMMALFGGCVIVGAAVSRLFWLLLEPSVDLAGLVSEPGAVLDPRQGGHSSFGALAGALAVVGLWLRSVVRAGSPERTNSDWRRWSSDAAMRARAGLDTLVVGGLAALAMARIGCLANGCDFGKPTDLGWSIRHGRHSDAFGTHLERGWVTIDAALSAPVHPFALYLTLGTLMVVAWGIGAIWRGERMAGQVALGASGAYLLLRFVCEWTRDASTVLNLYAAFNVHHLFAALGFGVVAAGWFWLDTCDQRAARSSLTRDP